MVIADVADRKVPATLLMAVSRTIIRSLSENKTYSPASKLVEYLNRLITEKNKANVSLTLFYGILDSESKEMSFVNTGHSPPLVFKNKNNKITALEKEDILLGEKRNIKLKEHHISLDKGDILVFHTDGIYSVVDRKENISKLNLSTISSWKITNYQQKN